MHNINILQICNTLNIPPYVILYGGRRRRRKKSSSSSKKKRKIRERDVCIVFYNAPESFRLWNIALIKSIKELHKTKQKKDNNNKKCTTKTKRLELKTYLKATKTWLFMKWREEKRSWRTNEKLTTSTPLHGK